LRTPVEVTTDSQNKSKFHVSEWENANLQPLNSVKQQDM